MSNDRAEELIRKYLQGTATPQEESLLESWYISVAQSQPGLTDEPDHDKLAAEMLESLRAEQQQGPAANQPAPKQPAADRPGSKPVIRLWPRFAAAAAVAIVLCIGSIYFFRKDPMLPAAQAQSKGDILPAVAGASLRLLDGRTVALDSASGQEIPRQGNSAVRVIDGRLSYRADGTVQTAAAGTNTLTTEKGQHYALLLPDSSKVWLNAGSSITYPVVFDGKERKVTVTGEAYFEIVHNAKRPFRIAVKDQLVEDIGTHFNINAYDDEPVVKTTLLEGGVKVSKAHRSSTLTAGQQAVSGPNETSFKINKVDGEGAIAWKDGYFYFNHADIKTVMREFSRWYNVEIVYKGDMPKQTFKGKVYRNINASEALSILSYFGAHFRIEGRTITVSS